MGRASGAMAAAGASLARAPLAPRPKTQRPGISPAACLGWRLALPLRPLAWAALSSQGLPSAVHWSLGGPWMPGYDAVEFAALWRRRYRAIATDLLTGDLNALFPLV